MDAPLLALGVESAFGECCDNRPFHPPTGYATWRSGGQPRRRAPVPGRQPSKNRVGKASGLTTDQWKSMRIALFPIRQSCRFLRPDLTLSLV